MNKKPQLTFKMLQKFESDLRRHQATVGFHLARCYVITPKARRFWRKAFKAIKAENE